MLRSVKSFHKYHVKAGDTQVGRIYDLLFESADWVVRYIVVEIHTWDTEKYVLLTPADFTRLDVEAEAIVTTLTKNEVYGMPELSERPPVSLRYQTRLHDNIDLPQYWPAYGYYHIPPHGDLAEVSQRVSAEILREGDTNLWSARQITGYHVQAINGGEGRIEDLIMDDDNWSIIDVAIDIGKWLPGKKVIVPPAYVKEIRWDEETVYFDMSIQSIGESTEYDPSAPINVKEECKVKVYDYLGRPR
ncbi:MAG: hypothetical protein HQK89_02715 [Nitrospirae bacterium]|nr:hypothetical protein [Nitrospirota bacterium]